MQQSVPRAGRSAEAGVRAAGERRWPALPIHADLASTGGPRFTEMLSGPPIEMWNQRQSAAYE